MNHSIFKKYDIRGIVGQDFTPQDAELVTKGILTHLLSKDPGLTSIAVGMDGRIHSPEIHEIIVQTIADMGIDVVDLEVCPTPVLSLVLFTTSTTTGFMVTASHNPGQYNGIKIFHDTKAVWGKEIEQIKKLVENKTFISPSAVTGSVSEHDAIATYAAWTRKNFPHLVGIDTKIAFDCSNGAAGSIMPLLLDTMEWKNAKMINQDVDGTFPNHGPDPTKQENLEQLAKFVKKEKLDFGICFDGDADRMTPISKNGKIIHGDKVLSMFANSILKSHTGAAVVYDVKGSSVVKDVVNSCGGKAVMSATGHACIREKMDQENAVLGGEMSCHFFFKDRNYGYDDGIYAAFRLIEILHLKKCKIENLLEELPKRVNTDEIKLPCSNLKVGNTILSEVKLTLAKTASSLITIDGVRAEMEHGWGLVRASNTEPFLSIRLEADTQDHLEEIKKSFIAALSSHYNKDTLEKHFSTRC